MNDEKYSDAYVQELFDRMGPTYDFVNLISSFGFAEFWRRECVANVGITPGANVCDMMSGSGECWRYALRHRPSALLSLDFSPVMVKRQYRRRQQTGARVEVMLENALQTSIAGGSVDCLVSAFGLKTLDHCRFAALCR